MKLSLRSMSLRLILILFLPGFAFGYSDEVHPSLEVLSGYRPMIALFGKPLTKIQLSFKAQIVRGTPLYAAYTQLSYWQLFEHSLPFLSNDYQPELFYRVQIKNESHDWLDLGFYNHESNGKDGDDSRSWDRSYLRYSHLGALLWSIQAWVPYRYDDNIDILHYRGLYEFSATLSDFLGPYFERGDLSLRLYSGGPAVIHPFLGGQELTFRMKIASSPLLPLFVLQLFHGYAENLLQYRETHWQVRAGIGF